MSYYDEEDGFVGAELQVFTGDRTQTEVFRTQWIQFVAVNNITHTFTSYRAAMLFLTYVKGPLVNTWVHGQLQWLQAQRAAGVDMNNTILAETVASSFDNTFTDTMQMEHARLALKRGIVMQGNDFDEYVSQFEMLVRQARYAMNAPQTIDKFTEGIPFALMESCMNEDPITYEDWKKALEKRVLMKIHMEACRPELSRHRHSPSPTPSLSPSVQSLEEEEVPPAEAREKYKEPVGYGEEYDKAAYDAPPLEEEEEYTIPDDAFEPDSYTVRPKVKREKKKKQVRFNEWTDEYWPPAEAREEYYEESQDPPAEAREEYFTPQDLEAPPPPPLPTPWSQQVEVAHREVAQPSTWAQYQFHPDAMDQGARIRVRAMRQAPVCHPCHQQGHIRPACPNRQQPRQRWPRVRPSSPIPVIPPPPFVPTVIPTVLPRVRPPTPEGRAAKLLKKLEDDPELHEELDRMGVLDKYFKDFVNNQPKELRVPVTFVTTKGQLTVSALVDSGATVNVIAPLLARRLGLEIEKYNLPQFMYNVDGTTNANGAVREYTKLSVTANNQYTEMDFTLIDTAVDLVLGFPWLSHFEPQINWKKATLDEKFWPTVRNIPTNLEEARSSSEVKPATSVRELARNALLAASIPRRESQAWGPCPRKEGNVTDSPPPARAGAIYHEESREEPPMDLPSEEDIHFWTYGDKKDEETVRRMLDPPEDAEEAETPYSICGCIIELGEDEKLGD